MTKTFLHFRPEYVREFKCDGSKCDARCCRGWNIFVDAGTCAQYSQLKSKFDATEILSHMNFDNRRGEFLVTLDERGFCPFLTDEKLCRLQLDYGENFLSKTCATYPRRTFDFGQFFERSLTLSCPVAAKLILLRDEPLKFEFVEVSEPEHSRGGKLKINPVNTQEGLPEKMLRIQVAMISILQRRTLSIDGRLIVLGFFLDKLDELITDGLDDDALTKLIAAYESETFLTRHVPRMLASVRFDEKNFSALMLELVDKLADEKFSLTRELLTRRQIFADERKLFTARRANFMENFLVNELFISGYPWKFSGIAKNFGVFVATYKLFELMTFAAQNNSDDELLSLTVAFARAADHDDGFTQIIFDSVPDDIFASLEALTDA